MNEILSSDADMDFVDGLVEPGGLIWIGDSWSLADSPVGTAFRRYGVVGGLDSQGCSTLQDDFELDQCFDLAECSPVAIFAQRAGHLVGAFAA